MRTAVICVIALLFLTPPSYGAEQPLRPQPAAVLPSASASTEPVPIPDVEDAEYIVITGQRRKDIRRLMLDFIVEIGDPVSRNQGYARWRKDVCVGVHNLKDRETAQYVADRISLVALEAGLKPGEPGCRPNLFILFAPDGRQAVAELMAASPNMFRPFGGAGGTTQGLHALEQFKTSEAPVRWWQIMMIVDEMGNPAIDLNNGMGTPYIRGSGSRIRNSVSDDLLTSYVIVDVSKLGNATWPQITDYLAMVSLAQVDPKGLPANHDSILNLFSASSPAGGMTELDRSYLRALYRMDTMLMPSVQRGVLASEMLRVREKEGE